mgnify:CR=1 FL=1
MNRVILDASALLALLNSEPGQDIVEQLLPRSIMSTVNVSETISELYKKLNIDIATGKHMVETVIKEILPFSFEQAVEAAALRTHTSKFGLSLGDRACLSLAKERQYPVYTADTIWTKLDIGVTINLIR